MEMTPTSSTQTLESKISKNSKIIVNVVKVISVITTVALIYVCLKYNLLTSKTAMEHFIGQFGMLGPVILIAYMAIQVVIPFLPSNIWMASGMLMYGSFFGFIYNYIGITIGSIAVFFISKKFGPHIMNALFSENAQAKYQKLTNNPKFDLLFGLLILSPVTPSAYLCYLAGITKITARKYILVIILCKIPSLLAYTYGLQLVSTLLLSFFK
ncbi:Hypothetical protein Tpal_631 [Trichococcus palustris]|jgi:uncharacterized membrane protein YdjX (TVP38/TMEM64 family)|uniref:TVP38/TMEM64 family membrane protein n=1 Tax=Trichococcus palustris TaxID=140314 RepID=A0A143YD43_9LACT|nr:VTT domain-containing protein [Trichococcus palustris]CZQ85427.1 Hypothetical protein Tpal_631 [Trichococcus palustris]SFK55887.1 Uncharacterized membrane protein YdjX, TVP38/TMEM64 family, SNARE-associated domain [Trichococcus palustris]